MVFEDLCGAEFGEVVGDDVDAAGVEEGLDEGEVFLCMVKKIGQVDAHGVSVDRAGRVDEFLLKIDVADEELVFAFVVGIEGAAACIGFVDNVLDSDGVVAFFQDQVFKGFRKGRFCFLGPAVGGVLFHFTELFWKFVPNRTSMGFCALRGRHGVRYFAKVNICSISNYCSKM